jgi:hypothetical protein
MVVFSEVKRRKRTVMGGIGALGRKARYSCSKMGTNSALTTSRVSLQGAPYGGLAGRDGSQALKFKGLVSTR